jgi:hypothetical protein
MTFGERLRDLLYGDETASTAAMLTDEERQQIEEFIGQIRLY